MANHLPVRPMPVWISSAMSRMPCSSQIFLILPMYSGGRHDEATLALHRLGDDRGHVVGVHVLGERVLAAAPRTHTRRTGSVSASGQR